MEEKNNPQEEEILKKEEAKNNPEKEVSSTTEQHSEASAEEPEGKKEKSHKGKHRKEDKVEELENEVAGLNDKFLRLYSEFDNYRKRSLKERIELNKTASADVISTLLPVLDDFERALKAMEIPEGDVKSVADGVGLIYNKLKSILNQQGLETMKALGESFDTDFHEALTNIPAPEPEQKGKVVDVIQNGYMLNGKVIRYAKVVVGS
ncbi:MAG: nucleotide exchange factor GrpE [Bacteroidetes bacterium]|nr:nucleotide exchange factor GrpE [Bacteroidota bacterium]